MVQSTLQPSPPGYAFAAADVRRATFTPEQLGQIILAGSSAMVPVVDPFTGNITFQPRIAVQGDNGPDLRALLAALLKSQRKANARFQPAAFSFPTFQLQQIFTENPNRNYLILQNVGSNDLMMLFEPGPASPQDFSAATAQQQLVNAQTRAIRIVAGGFYEPQVPPTNAISIFTLNGITNGVCIEGA